jgi:hypothetical protein
VSQSKADRFKSKAEECRRRAAQAESEGDKEAWLRLAVEWDRLAKQAGEGRGFYDRYDTTRRR